MPCDVLLEGEVDELGVQVGAFEAEDEEAAGELARAQAQVVGAGGRAGLGELDQRADDGGDEQPLALGDRLGVGAERRGRGRGGEQAAGRSATSTGCSRPERGLARSLRPRLRVSVRTSLRRAAADGGASAPPQASSSPSRAVICLPYRHGRTAPCGGARERAGCLLPASRPGRRLSGAAWPGGPRTWATGRSRRCSKVALTRSTRWSRSCAAGPGTRRCRVDVPGGA